MRRVQYGSQHWSRPACEWRPCSRWSSLQSDGEPLQHGHGEREQHPECEGLPVAAAGGVSRVPAQQVHATRHRVQVRPPSTERRGAERTRHSLLRLN